MIKAKFGAYDGNTWEELCQVCLKLKFESEGYQELPAWQGDMGIEGFTRTGKAFQCYCPDEDYEPRTLYEKQRDKITKDLNKLEVNIKELKDYLKDIRIVQWIFLTPLYRNKELIRHCQNKVAEYKAKNLEILSGDFDILIYDEDYFTAQIPIALNANGQKIEINVEQNSNVDWNKSNIDLIEHAIEKHGKRLHPQTKNKEDKVNKLTEQTVGDFLHQQQILNKWKELNPADYEKFIRIISDYESTVEELCITHTDNNNQLYERIRNELKNKLKDNFSCYDDLTLEKLTKGVIADWILRCPINFE